MRRLTALLGLALLLASAPASGSPRRHENVTRLGENERRRLPTVLSNQRVGMDGQVDDLFLFAQYGEVAGRVDDNVYAFCQTLELSGTVGGDVYAFCQTLRIRGQVEGDVYVGGGELLLEPGAAIGGCLLGGVGEGSLEGRVDGPVKLGAGELMRANIDVASLLSFMEQQGAMVGGDGAPATIGMAAVVDAVRREIAPVVSLYVNDWNTPARRAYERVGFVETARFTTVMF